MNQMRISNNTLLVGICMIPLWCVSIATLVISAVVLSRQPGDPNVGMGMGFSSGNEPLVTSQLSSSYHTVTADELLQDWHCYLGRSGFPKIGQDFPRPAWGAILNGLILNRDYYATQTPSSDNINQMTYMIANSPYLTEPTHGLQKYVAACNDLPFLVKNDSAHSLSLRTTLGFFTTQEEHPFVEDDGKIIDNYPIEAPRVESKKVFPNGGIFVLKTRNIPHGVGAWPAFWMLGTTTKNWDDPKWNGIGAASTWPFQGQGEIDLFEYVDGTYADHPVRPEDFKVRRFVTLHTPGWCTANIEIPIGNFSASLECQGGGDANATTQVLMTNVTAGLYEQGTQGEKNGGCVASIDMTDTPDWLSSNMTFVFNWDPQDTKVESFSFETDSNSTELVNSILAGSERLNPTQIGNLARQAGNQSSRHTYAGCDGVFENMHLILNTALCGDWAGGKEREECEEHVADRFGVNALIPLIGDNPEYLAYWNMTSEVSRDYSWDIEELSYRAYM